VVIGEDDRDRVASGRRRGGGEHGPRLGARGPVVVREGPRELSVEPHTRPRDLEPAGVRDARRHAARRAVLARRITRAAPSCAEVRAIRRPGVLLLVAAMQGARRRGIALETDARLNARALRPPRRAGRERPDRAGVSLTATRRSSIRADAQDGGGSGAPAIRDLPGCGRAATAPRSRA
jgi:hypothetical protein